jgi:prevent-host-death family protein
MRWSLIKAEDNLEDVVRRAGVYGPQTLTVDGEDVALVISKAHYDLLRSADRPRDFKAWLLSLRDLGELDLERDQTPARDIEL